MLGILLIFFIGKYFYKLAEEYKKNKWLFAILGVVTYYIGAFIGGILLAVLDEILGLGINWENDLVLSILAIPAGLGIAYVLYFLLKKNWKNTVIVEISQIQDIGKNIEE